LKKHQTNKQKETNTKEQNNTVSQQSQGNTELQPILGVGVRLELLEANAGRVDVAE
jgi:hypothetical protein